MWVLAQWGIEGAEQFHAEPAPWCDWATGNLFMWPLQSLAVEGQDLLLLWPGGACCGAKAAIPCGWNNSRLQVHFRVSIPYHCSHAGDWFVLVTDSCDNEVIVRRQSVHRNVFMSYDLGSWGFCALRGSVSSWLGQSKGQNTEWLYKKNPCCFLICIRG